MATGNEFDIVEDVTERPAPPRTLGSRIKVTVALLLCVYLVAVWWTRHWNPVSFASNLKPSFDGDSQALQQTQIVPTLDTPIEKGKNVIWCATFVAGWKQLEQEITHGPASLTDAADVCARLSSAWDPASSMTPESFYAKAGWSNEGILQTISSDMRERFPAHPAPTFPGISPDSFVMYSYMQVQAPFNIPYFDNRGPVEFTDSRGVKTPIRTFGIREEDHDKYLKLHEQPKVLLARPQGGSPGKRLSSFAVDLDQKSYPYQIIVAHVEPGQNLAETVATLEREINEFEPQARHFALDERMLVPDIFYRLMHHFPEVEGRPFENQDMKGQRLDVALQDVQFRLDRSGAELSSEFRGFYRSAGTWDCVFDGPFLLYIKKRGEATPFFVMWVDNAELLQRWGS